MNKINHQIACDKLISRLTSTGERPSLLLHVCCAPCSSSVIEYLERAFDITLFFYNPNITDFSEFAYRGDELSRFISERPGDDIPILTPEYDNTEFFAIAAGLENEPEGGARCERCFRLRLRRTAVEARRRGIEYFTSTLSVSPYKNAGLLCRIGAEIASEEGLKYLESDFKKHGGYLRSIELSSAYGLYRQNYCGCRYSKAEADDKRRANNYDK